MKVKTEALRNNNLFYNVKDAKNMDVQQNSVEQLQPVLNTKKLH